MANAQALARALQERGIPCLAAHKGFTRTHQAIADVRQWGGGYAAANRLQEANIIVNKNLIPGDRPEDWDKPSGMRIGTIEVTRLGMGPAEMAAIADFMHDLLVKGRKPEEVRKRVVEFRRGFQTLYYCFENGLPPGLRNEIERSRAGRESEQQRLAKRHLRHHGRSAPGSGRPESTADVDGARHRVEPAGHLVA